MIIIEQTKNEIILDPQGNEIIIETFPNTLEFSNVGSKGPKGDKGEGVPSGGIARQTISKVDGTDYNTEWRSNWYDYAMNVEYTGVEDSVNSGTVFTCTIDSSVIYRFINSTDNDDGYPIEDSFYQNFDGSNITNLIATRG